MALTLIDAWRDQASVDAHHASPMMATITLNYQVLYKANYRTGYQVLAFNLLTSSNYSFSLNAIPMQADIKTPQAFGKTAALLFAPRTAEQNTSAALCGSVQRLLYFFFSFSRSL